MTAEPTKTQIAIWGAAELRESLMCNGLRQGEVRCNDDVRCVREMERCNATRPTPALPRMVLKHLLWSARTDGPRSSRRPDEIWFARYQQVPVRCFWGLQTLFSRLWVVPFAFTRCGAPRAGTSGCRLSSFVDLGLQKTCCQTVLVDHEL